MQLRSASAEYRSEAWTNCHGWTFDIPENRGRNCATREVVKENLEFNAGSNYYATAPRRTISPRSIERFSLQGEGRADSLFPLSFLHSNVIVAKADGTELSAVRAVGSNDRNS